MALPANHSESADDDDDIENYPVDTNARNPNSDPDDHAAVVPPPIRYLPLDHVYSATSPCPPSSPKKPLLRKFSRHSPPLRHKVPVVVHVYSRRAKRLGDHPNRPSLFFTLLARENSRLVKEEEEAVVLDDVDPNPGVVSEDHRASISGNEKLPDDKKIKKGKKKRRRRKSGSEQHDGEGLVPGRLRERREIGSGNGYCETAKRRKRDPTEAKKVAVDNVSGLPGRKRWVRLAYPLLYSFYLYW